MSGEATSPDDRVRLDVWMWSIRLFKTRSASTTACNAGGVRLNGAPAKASKLVRPGDLVSARVHGNQRELQVVQLLKKRVGADVAASAYIDNSPPPEPSTWVATLAHSKRDSGTGRPTKRDRRQIDQLRNPDQ